MIKMIVTDLDGTLLKKDKSMSQYTVDVIKQVRKLGIKVIFATAGENPVKLVVPFELFDGYVLLNGAKAYVIINWFTIEQYRRNLCHFLRISQKNFKLQQKLKTCIMPA